MDPRIDDLITYYVDRNPQDWFFPPENFDEELRSRYGDLVTEARSEKFDSWADTPKGALAMVILLDQIPRNIFRGSGESFSSDAKARSIATRAVARDFDKQLGESNKYQQYIIYLPFMHAEDLLAQVASRALYSSLLNSCTKGTTEFEFIQRAVPFAQQHLDCIARLGRFPKRNKPSGRETTAEEEAFLKEHPGGF